MGRFTARQYGAMMRHQGISWPAPTIGQIDMLLPSVRIYRIGSRQLSNAFVFVRKDWATVYVRPAYTAYRSAYSAVHPRAAMGREVDHLQPRSTAAPHDFCALGVLTKSLNASWNDADDPADLSQKLFNIPRNRPHRFTSTLTDLARGWAVASGFITPFREIDTAPLTRQTREEIEAAGAG